jgi:hypothetical protein
LGFLVFGIGIFNSCQSNSQLNNYQGKPFQDSMYSGGAQLIPGKLQCEFYDFGGEGISFHDSDTINSGSGGLNPANGIYLNEFRINEPVDISYTKFQEPAIDNSMYNMVEPTKDQLYVGWTKPGEWVKYTVNVQETGTYKVGIMFTSNKDGKISIAVNNKDVTGPIMIPSTYVEADSVPWRQWHHWNRLEKIACISLEKGLQTVTLHTVEVGDMNYDYLEFTLLK